MEIITRQFLLATQESKALKYDKHNMYRKWYWDKGIFVLPQQICGEFKK